MNRPPLGIRLFLNLGLLVLLIQAFCPDLRGQEKRPDYCKWVNPFIGTLKMGHTFPGATVPFGSVQLSPETDTVPFLVNGAYNPGVYAYCAGYQYGDSTVVGFSHTHFSGTGHSDLGDILIMPLAGGPILNPGTKTDPSNGFRSVFHHNTEVAEPGYYAVTLEDEAIRAEMTATTRVGMHRYTYPAGKEQTLILDLISGIYPYDGKNVWTFVRVENDSLLTGYRQTTGWARTRTVYFAIAFSKPIRHYGHRNFQPPSYKGFWRKFDQEKDFPEMAGKALRAWFSFGDGPENSLVVKVALSPVSTAGAMANLSKEVPHWDFDRVRSEAHRAWNRELGRVHAEFTTPGDRVNFYTALYHAFLSPTVYMDCDSSYRGLDQNIHLAQGFTNYTTFSLWDTYRALHPLFNLIQPARNGHMIRSMLAHQSQSVHRMLPVWSHYACENWCMIGYHGVSVIADAVVKSTPGFNAEEALRACVETASNMGYDGLGDYMARGFVPEDRTSSSVSKTLEYAYDDWCIARLAEHVGQAEIRDRFDQRSLNYRNLFDPRLGFMRPRLADGTFKSPFDVLSTHGQGFIEGNAWNYSLSVPHQPDSLIALMGGAKRFVPHLDSLFRMELPDRYFAETEDITREGLIGNYVHGNEPSHHVPYLFNEAGQPWKTQAVVRDILRRMYQPRPDGLSGNDDCGQMSAWYVFSALGFYPFCPGSDMYYLGSPLVSSAIIRFENGNALQVEVRNQSDENVYVRQVRLNGVPLKQARVRHNDLLKGGVLEWEMGPKPNRTLFRD